MVVASVDTKSGRTVLISLPRNFERVPLQSRANSGPLAQRIYGVPTCPRQRINASDRCMLNAIWTEVDDYRATNPDAYPGVAVPGRSETRDVIAEIVGLKINHMVVIDLKGFQQLIDAMGGVDVNIKLAGPNGDQPLPYGKDYGNGRYSDYFTKPGVHHLTGYEALWYAHPGRRRRLPTAIPTEVCDQGGARPGQTLGDDRQVPPTGSHRSRQHLHRCRRRHAACLRELVERIQQSSIDSLGFTSADGFNPARPDYGRLREPREGRHRTSASPLCHPVHPDDERYDRRADNCPTRGDAGMTTPTAIERMRLTTARPRTGASQRSVQNGEAASTSQK